MIVSKNYYSAFVLLIGIAFVSFWTQPAAAQNKTNAKCIIASSDGVGVYRTDIITDCRVNMRNGSKKYVYNGEKRGRTYLETQPLTTRHIAVAQYWQKRIRKLNILAEHNPAGFNLEPFLREAAKAKSGYVLVRDRRGENALNLVFFTDGVMRSIDLPGTKLKDVPLGFMTTAQP